MNKKPVVDKNEIIIQLNINKKINEEKIKTIKSSLNYKIFDILETDNEIFYLDKEFNLIWNVKKEIVGIINKNVNYFFSKIDIIIDEIKQQLLKKDFN